MGRKLRSGLSRQFVVFSWEAYLADLRRFFLGG